MKLTLHTFLTLDGVMQGPGGFEEDRSGGFDRGGWLVPHVDQDFGEIVDGWFTNAEATLLGRSTYAMMQVYWSQVTDPDNRVATVLNTFPKYVATSTPLEPEWGDSTVLSGDVIKQVQELKDKPGGELQVHGSCGLARSLHEAGLIDEYRLLTFPVVVGKGKRLFTDGGTPSGFTVNETRVTSTGVIYATLTPAPFSTGAVQVEDGKETV
jgi:dihydrofolate reductase